MGYLSNESIIEFVKGQVIDELTNNGTTLSYLFKFKSGESLRVYPYKERGELTIIATPFDEHGNVKQSTVIMAEAEEKKAKIVYDEHIRYHAMTMMGLEWDGENYYRISGQYALVPGSKMIVTIEEIKRSMSCLMSDCAKYGCD